MLHSVAPPSALAPHEWLADLATPPELLEASFRMWRKRGYTTLSLQEFEKYLEGHATAPRRSLVLTLDDGYVDNWIALLPLLREYDVKATIFVSTDFIDPRPITRPQMSAAIDPTSLPWKGFLSWNELREMVASGLVDIQSHAKTHTWYFVSDEIMDYYRPEIALTTRHSLLRFLWLNDHVDRKPFCLDEMTDNSVPWGTPIYDFKPSLVARRYIPDAAESEVVATFVEGRGGACFFRQPGWKEVLDREVRRYRAGRRATRERETEAEFDARVTQELEGSRRILSDGLGTDICYLAFPNGAFEPKVAQIAAEVGYRLHTVASWRSRKLNVAGGPNRAINRCGSGYGLFGRAGAVSMKVLSQQVVLLRYSGDLAARLLTGAVSSVARYLPRRP